jgi:hypothetical protein
MIVFFPALLAGHKKLVSNGVIGAYRTRAWTGSLKPKRYLTSEDEEENQQRIKHKQRARSYSSRDSSLNYVGEEEEVEDSDEESGNASNESEPPRSDSDDDHRRKGHYSSKHGHKRKHESSKKSKKSKKRRRMFFSSDDDNDTDGTDDEGGVRRKKEKRRHKEKKPGPHHPLPRDASGRFCSTGSSGSRKKRDTSGSHSSGTRTTRNQGKRTLTYLEDSWDEFEEDPSRLSVSSRGRVRKMTKRARANRADD